MARDKLVTDLSMSGYTIISGRMYRYVTPS